MSREDHLTEVAEWEEAVCDSCGSPFPKRSHYERRCLVCYKADRDYNVLAGDKAFLWAQVRIDDLRTQLQNARSELEANTRGNSEQPQDGLKGDLLRQLISLCHPDHHGGSKKATDVTKKLLAIRAATRRSKRSRK
jgi:hypothetical protein